MAPISDRPFPLLAVVSLLVGVGLLGWAVLGLYTATTAELSRDGASDTVEARCHGVMSQTRDVTPIEVLVEGEPYDGRADYANGTAVEDSIARADDACLRAGTRRVARSLQLSLAGVAVLLLSAPRWRRWREDVV